MLEIGIMESIFHVVSCIFEIPSGAFADVFGRKRSLTLSKLTSILSSFLMILSANFWTTAIAIGFSAISYNLESGTREVLAYDSLKSVNCENDYNKLIMLINAFIGAVSTLVLFFLQAKLPLAGLNNALLGPALFIMVLGAALGSKVIKYVSKLDYRKFIIFSSIGVAFAFCMTFTGNPYIMILGGFIGSFSDDFLEVRTDVILNDMIPSKQRATLISVNSFTFSLVMIVMSTVMGNIM